MSWSRWQPSAEQPWNLARVAHLHRRAGFGATWRELRRDLKDGPRAAVDRLLQGRARMDHVAEDFAPVAEAIGDAAVGSDDPQRLMAWWIYRMLFSADPLAEKLTWMWHNHFAVSNSKIRDLELMRRQNNTFRRLGRGHFGPLLEAVAHDPAMLIWLDNTSNRLGKPNENLARELMELFTLGVGNYSEQDVKQGACALTGWTVRNRRFFIDDDAHDKGEKTILGQRGAWRGDDFLRILLDQRATSRRLAWRICDTFMGEGCFDDAAIDDLAAGLRERHLNIGWAVAKVLRSQAFFAEANIASRVASPIEFVLSAVRSLEYLDPPSSTLRIADWITRCGLRLFYPPNVGGWPGGRHWLSPHHVVARANFAAALAKGGLHPKGQAPDVARLAKQRGAGEGDEALVAFLDQLLLGGRLSPPDRDRILSIMAGPPNSDAQRASRVVALILSLPESQLG